MICKNCNNNFSGRFCNSCGQRASVGRVNLSYITELIFTNLLQIDRGAGHTFVQLSTRPGHSIREYLDGQRVDHFKPLSYLLLASAIYVFFAYISGTDTYLSEFIDGMTATMRDGEGEGDRKITLTMLTWSVQNFAYTTLLLLPFFALASTIAFKSFAHNYFEHLILNLYITGHIILFHSLSEVIHYGIGISHYYQQAIPLFAGLLYTFVSYHQFFKRKKAVNIFLRTALSYLLYGFIIIFILVTLIITDIYMN